MKTIKTDRVLKTFKDENIKNEDIDFTIGDFISHVLGGKVSNPTLGWVLGKKFATEKTVDLKAEDVIFIKKEIEASDFGGALLKGQVLEILEEKDLEPETQKNK